MRTNKTPDPDVGNCDSDLTDTQRGDCVETPGVFEVIMDSGRPKSFLYYTIT